VDEAVAGALRMVAEGADIIDIGGESTRPGAEPVGSEEEQRRVLPVIRALRPQTDAMLSIDTYRRSTAERALDAGVNVINDISALRMDPVMADLVAVRRVPIVLMHMQGTPRDMQIDPSYEDCVSEIAAFFEERIGWCEQRGISRSQLILDPGIGFGKRLSDNLEILGRLHEFKRFGLPLLVGASRKSFIGSLAGKDTPVSERLGGSIAAALLAVKQGVDILRVHDVRQTAEALAVMQAVEKSE
jgi:dihydropteroate synthase